MMKTELGGEVPSTCCLGGGVPSARCPIACSYEVKRMKLRCMAVAESEQESYILIIKERTDVLVMFG